MIPRSLDEHRSWIRLAERRCEYDTSPPTVTPNEAASSAVELRAYSPSPASDQLTAPISQLTATDECCLGTWRAGQVPGQTERIATL